MLFCFFIQSGGLAFSTFDFNQNAIFTSMKTVINLKLEIRSDSEKTKPNKVAPYVRVRNGKKELVRGYILKKKGL